MSKIKRPQDISYLSFQGGGGLGFAYLGAVEALELLKVLPGVRPDGQIKGISGTSAGAITAMFLAIGCTSKDLADVFKSSADFDTFYDPPAMGKVRGLVTNDHFALVNSPGEKGSLQDFAKKMVELRRWQVSNQDELSKLVELSWIQSLDVRSSGAALFLALKLIGQADLLAKSRSVPFLDRFSDRFNEYMYSLIFDRGIFVGLTVRKYLRKKFAEFVSRLPAWRRYPRLKDPSTMTFAMLKDLTNVDLAVCATNISQKRSVTFSARTTPSFPVVEAVGMSACFPIVFKPIYVQAPASDPVLGSLRGLWLDGGILNNIPIHAFDSEPRPRKTNTSALLHPEVLALRLVEGAPRSFEIYDDPTEDALPFVGLLRDLYHTFRFPSGDGQFLTDEERQQSVDLFTFDLSLFQFAPSQNVARNPVSEARKAVLEYFQ